MQVAALLVRNDIWEYVIGVQVNPEVTGEDAEARAISQAAQHGTRQVEKPV